ncbi:hypothetical protein GCM10009718_35740 [Isoptericola halotolerans]|uniref:Uncharacterized protein n=1 Tax=Isoptericola halotolerans TaxID=300560 RepID=A0ABX2A336_9MICO|nr:hypothetical protein [Isoptericola halotolerans]NOV97219.1 hypothetical protein [Isoptericola halotolerans]
MTSTTDGVPADKQDLLIELTGFELLSLLAVSTEDAARRTREHLHLPEVASDSPLLTAGVSSLLVRGLCTMESGTLRPQSRLDALVTVLTRANQWLEAAGIADRTTGSALLVGSELGGALLEPRPYSIWHAWPMPPSPDLPTAGARFVRSQFENNTGRPFAGSLKLTTASGSRISAVHVDTAGRWELASGPGDTVPEAVGVGADPSFRVLAEALA